MTLNLLTQKSFVLHSGERFCLLVDKATGLPLYYPNLFLITQVRNRSLSFSSMETALASITILLKYLSEKNEYIEDRFENLKFLDINEIDGLCDFCQKKFKKKSKRGEIYNLNINKRGFDDGLVATETMYVRITIIAEYIQWLAQKIIINCDDKFISNRIFRMVEALKARRPLKSNRNAGLVEKGLTERQVKLLFEIIRPGSSLSPFTEESVKVRNRLIVLLLFYLGIRGGELLNIRVRDIDFTNNQILIIRRADEGDDPRLDQPNAKTRDRRLPLKDTLSEEIYNYVIKYRKLVVSPKQPDYLFVTHKKGPSQGLPISKSGYKKVINTLSAVDSAIFQLSGHKFRHTWNDNFSRQMDSLDVPPTEERQEEIRSNLMGWKPGSGTAAIYNKRFIKYKSFEASLKLQEGINEKPI